MTPGRLPLVLAGSPGNAVECWAYRRSRSGPAVMAVVQAFELSPPVSTVTIGLATRFANQAGFVGAPPFEATDHESVAVAGERQRRYTMFAGLGARGPEEQDVIAGEEPGRRPPVPADFVEDELLSLLPGHDQPASGTSG